MLVQVESSFKISSCMFVKVSGTSYKIRIFVEDTNIFADNSKISAKGLFSEEKDNESENNLHGDIMATVVLDIFGVLKVFHEIDVVPKLLSENDGSDIGYSSMLSELELARGAASHIVQDWHIIPYMKICTTKKGLVDKCITGVVGKDAYVLGSNKS